MARAENPGGVWGGDTPPQYRESSPRRANDSKWSGQFQQIRKKLPPNHLITKCNTVLFVGQYEGHALFVGHCSYIPPQKWNPSFGPDHGTHGSREEYLWTTAHTKCARPESKATLKIYFLTAYAPIRLLPRSLASGSLAPQQPCLRYIYNSKYQNITGI